MGSWAHGLSGTWALGSWALGLLGTRALGHSGSWALGLLGSLALWHFGSWAHATSLRIRVIIFIVINNLQIQN
jgi:hypothetical protein